MIEYKKRVTLKLRAYKKRKGCEICGYNKTGVSLDFAHKNPTEKSHHLCIWYYKKQKGSGMKILMGRITKYGTKLNRERWKELKDEIRKCKVLCKNCHYEETYKNKEVENGSKLSKIRQGLTENKSTIMEFFT